MPEGPECRHITDCLNEIVSTRQLCEISILGGRYKRHAPFNGYLQFNELLNTSIINVVSIQCHGKFIYWNFSNGYSLWNTLGMSGQWTTTQDKHCHVMFKFSDELVLYFRDIRNFGTLNIVSKSELLDKKLKTLGYDILSDTPLDQTLYLNIFYKRKDWNICKFLMDQRYFSGVGNYIKSEALYIAKVNPFLTIKELSDSQLSSIYEAVREIAHKSYLSKGASFNTFKDPDSNKGRYSFEFKVYGQVKCGEFAVKRDKTPDNRSTYWIPEICS